ncbi:hypothetical protein ESCO_006403 [Escovopsis weberi]|uniref:Endosomal spry domain-containing protein n=1 Tax=Escovopsis weberi TaxID=150374 RepID=A0A0M8MUU6_ESCWE|nr:hypothetical protein ESCO_006403 [Escovopsis weberi]
MAPAIALRDVLAGRAADARLAEAGRLLLHEHLSRRDDNSNKSDPSEGVLDPHDMNNVGFFFLFALIGVAFVVTGIWFFFWAKDGGFHFRDDDWDDYKSTVMRRKGPNGTILSNATKSTKLGGGSIYRKYDEDEDDDRDRDDWDGGRTEITESTALSGITAGPSDIYAREKREEKRRRREAEKRRKRGAERDKDKDRGKSGGGGGKKSKSRSQSRHAREGVLDEEAEKEAREQLRNYREERPARVGGLNKMAEGSDWEGSTNPAGSMLSSGMQSSSALSSAVTATEAASAGVQAHAPVATGGGGGGGGAAATQPSSSSKTVVPKGGGIRKVYSVADRTTARENERLRAEARRLREEGRSARRDLIYQRALGGAATRDEQSESLLSGSGSGSGAGGGGGGGGSSVGSSALSREHGGGGTKSYHHPLPELREHRRREREEKRARKGGYQRGNTRDEELEDEVD